MKFLFLLIATLITFQSTFSQTVHSLVFSYTEDSNIGNGCFIDYKTTKAEVGIISQALGYDLNEKHFTSNFSKANLDYAISNLNVNSKDIIFLYISTHGARSNRGDDNQFPQIVIPNNSSEIMVSSYNYIYSKIRRLNAKLTITLIDACNGYANITSKEVTIYSKTYEKKTKNSLSSFQKNNYQRLFEEVEGDIIITSSEPGKSSISTTAGSIFTNCFFQALHYYIDTEEDNNLQFVNWNNLLNRTKQYTLNESKRVSVQDNKFEPYYPVWESNLSKTLAAVNISTPEPPTTLKLAYRCKPLSSQQQRSTSNTHLLEYWISGDSEDLRKIEKVIYYLHETFPNPTHSNTNQNEQFYESFTVWGQFWLRSKIILKDGQEIELSRYTKFSD